METIKFCIVRRTSQYNKYIKWFREFYNNENKLISSIGYKTEKEARDFRLISEMPIGNRILITQYIEDKESRI